ncbi:hypothetical protein HN587_00785 [Candidatus Woesearchaeota archaeon]|jgi:hypothetical protein|nr:hypothetical protein [Candidatus Woesearchaeota archaeon]
MAKEDLDLVARIGAPVIPIEAVSNVSVDGCIISLDIDLYPGTEVDHVRSISVVADQMAADLAGKLGKLGNSGSKYVRRGFPTGNMQILYRELEGVSEESYPVIFSVTHLREPRTQLKLMGFGGEVEGVLVNDVLAAYVSHFV